MELIEIDQNWLDESFYRVQNKLGTLRVERSKLNVFLHTDCTKLEFLYAGQENMLVQIGPDSDLEHILDLCIESMDQLLPQWERMYFKLVDAFPELPRP